MTARLFCLAAFLGAIGPVSAGAAEGPDREAGPRERSSATSHVEHRVRPYYGARFHRGIAVQHHASTPAEAFARGLANLIAARAEARLVNAQARVVAAEAADREMDNHKKYVETGFEVRRMNRELRSAERGPRATAEDLARYAAAAKPDPLSPSELDARTGEVSWPVALLADRYAGFRAELERFFTQRADGALEPEDLLDVYLTAQDMLKELVQQSRELPPADYIGARRFVESLAYTARQPIK